MMWILLLSPLSWGAAEKPIAFNAALDRILARSTALAIQEANLQSTSASNLPARLAFLPQLSIDALQSTTRLGSNSNTIDRQLVGTASLNLLRFGADLAAFRAADAAYAQQEALLLSTRLQVEDQGVRALIAMIQRHKEIEILKQIVDARSELLRIARERYKRGFLPLQEVDKLNIDLEITRARMRDTETAESQARADLENFLGTSNIVVDWPWEDQMSKTGKALVAKKFETTEIPGVRAATALVEAEDFRVAEKLGLALPSVDASFAYGSYLSAGIQQPGWTATVGVTFPLFDHLTNYSSYRVQIYTRKIAEQNLEQTRRNSVAEWTSTRERFQLSLESALARSRVVSSSRKLYKDNLRRFQMGRIDANDLVVDQNRLSDSELLSIQGWATAHVDFMRLCHSLGQTLDQCDL